jgi:hypothetical protein
VGQARYWTLTSRKTCLLTLNKSITLSTTGPRQGLRTKTFLHGKNVFAHNRLRYRFSFSVRSFFYSKCFPGFTMFFRASRLTARRPCTQLTKAKKLAKRETSFRDSKKLFFGGKSRKTFELKKAAF